MTDRVGELAYILIDCNDPERIASFWGQVLGLEITERSHPYIDLARPGEGVPILSFQKVDEPKTTKNRLHLDVKVADLEIAAERIQSLGGRVVQEYAEDPYRWSVMADPEENEFCIVTD